MSHKIKPKRGPKQTMPTLEVGEIAITNDTYELFVGSTFGNKLVGASSFLLRDLSNLEHTLPIHQHISLLLTRLTFLGCHPVTPNNHTFYIPFTAQQHRLHVTLNGLTLSPLYDFTFVTDPTNEICGISLAQSIQDDDILQVSYIRKLSELPTLSLDLVIGLKYALQNCTAQSYSIDISPTEYYVKLDNRSLPFTTYLIGTNIDQKPVNADIPNYITNNLQFNKLWSCLLNYASPLAI